MTARSELNMMDAAIQKTLEKFQLEKKHTVSDESMTSRVSSVSFSFWLQRWTTTEILREAKKRLIWDSFAAGGKRDVNILLKWEASGLKEKNVLSTREILQRMWENVKLRDIVTTLTHPKFGSFSDKNEAIEVSGGKTSHMTGNVFYSQAWRKRSDWWLVHSHLEIVCQFVSHDVRRCAQRWSLLWRGRLPDSGSPWKYLQEIWCVSARHKSSEGFYAKQLSSFHFI